MIWDCIVVGAGLSGLTAARTLQQRGRKVLVVDKGRGVGGRMSTRRIDLETPWPPEVWLDHGAQYFTVRTPEFQALVDEALAAGAVNVWTHHVPCEPEEAKSSEGHPRYVGSQGMNSLPGFLAQELDVDVKTRIHRLSWSDNAWTLFSEDGRSWQSRSVVLTPPLPQTLTLLEDNNIPVPEDTRSALEALTYAPCLAVLAVLSGPSAVPEPGGLLLKEGPISWICDNHQKGISPHPTVTIHASPSFSEAHLEDDKEATQQALLDAAAPWLGSTVVTSQYHRWRYSLPLNHHTEPCVTLDEPGPVVLAGDVYGGPRVEGAALSGLAAADAIHAKLH
ncbi:MAG: FAD-dependent oxidoreductase [Deltaproteobacteria bacterium]|nr:MAG: FAD-dependent oxidoreductase [Deltaproteobacteria bacterium]